MNNLELELILVEDKDKERMEELKKEEILQKLDKILEEIIKKRKE
jgi:hypothetical protein